MSIEKARIIAKRASSVADPAHGISWLGQALYEIIEVLEDMSAKIDKLAESANRTGE